MKTSLEEFEAVEKALQKSPYVIPHDLYLMKMKAEEFQNGRNEATDATQQSDLYHDSESPIKEETDVNHDEKGKGVERVQEDQMAEDVIHPQETQTPEMEESSILGGSEWSLFEPPPADLEEIVEGYSRSEEVNTAASSPFVKHTQNRPTNPESETNMPIEETPVPETEMRDTEEPPEMQLSDATTLLVPSETGTALSRMSSIQRRGQEYLQYFIERRRQRTAIEEPPQAITDTLPPTIIISPQPPMLDTSRRRRRKQGPSTSPITIFLILLLSLSLIGNITQWRKIKQEKALRDDIWDEIMTPGKVGETFEIFTSPSKTRWNWWDRLKEGSFVSKDATTKSKSGSGVLIEGRRLAFGARGKRATLERWEGNFVGICWRGISFLEDLWNKLSRG